MLEFQNFRPRESHHAIGHAQHTLFHKEHGYRWYQFNRGREDEDVRKQLLMLQDHVVQYLLQDLGVPSLEDADTDLLINIVCGCDGEQPRFEPSVATHRGRKCAANRSEASHVPSMHEQEVHGQKEKSRRARHASWLVFLNRLCSRFAQGHVALEYLKKFLREQEKGSSVSLTSRRKPKTKKVVGKDEVLVTVAIQLVLCGVLIDRLEKAWRHERSLGQDTELRLLDAQQQIHHLTSHKAYSRGPLSRDWASIPLRPIYDKLGLSGVKRHHEDESDGFVLVDPPSPSKILRASPEHKTPPPVYAPTNLSRSSPRAFL